MTQEIRTKILMLRAKREPHKVICNETGVSPRTVRRVIAENRTQFVMHQADCTDKSFYKYGMEEEIQTEFLAMNLAKAEESLAKRNYPPFSSRSWRPQKQHSSSHCPHRRSSRWTLRTLLTAYPNPTPNKKASNEQAAPTDPSQDPKPPKTNLKNKGWRKYGAFLAHQTTRWNRNTRSNRRAEVLTSATIRVTNLNAARHQIL